MLKDYSASIKKKLPNYNWQSQLTDYFCSRQRRYHLNFKIKYLPMDTLTSKNKDLSALPDNLSLSHCTLPKIAYSPFLKWLRKILHEFLISLALSVHVHIILFTSYSRLIKSSLVRLNSALVTASEFTGKSILPDRKTQKWYETSCIQYNDF